MTAPVPPSGKSAEPGTHLHRDAASPPPIRWISRRMHQGQEDVVHDLGEDIVRNGRAPEQELVAREIGW